MGTIMWEMSLDTAEEFYKRCMERKAVTEEERIAILEELAREGKMNSVIQTNRPMEQVAQDATKKYGDVLWIHPKKEGSDENTPENC